VVYCKWVLATTAWHILRLQAETVDSFQMWRLGADIFISSHGQLTIGSFPYWGSGDRLKTAHLK